MKRTILFSFFLCLFAFGLNAQTTEDMDEMAKQEGLLQAAVAKGDLQRGLNETLDRYVKAVKGEDALEMRELETMIASQMDQMISLQSDPAEKSKQTSLLREFQTLNKKDKSTLTAMMSKLKSLKK